MLGNCTTIFKAAFDHYFSFLVWYVTQYFSSKHGYVLAINCAKLPFAPAGFGSKVTHVFPSVEIATS